jgi:hypothetical protein
VKNSFHSSINRLFSFSVLAVIIAAIAGCTTYHHAYLVPAPAATLSNSGESAVATADSVTITVVPNSWNGRPHNLYRKVTPVKVRIQNNSKVPVRLVYSDFQLQTPQGQAFAALPPSEITGVQTVGDLLPASSPHPQIVDVAFQRTAPHRTHVVNGGHGRIVIRPGFAWNNFYYAPYWGYGYYGMGPWPYGWAPNGVYFNTYYPYMSAVRLPTRSMLRKGLPEGVIAPGGFVEGFLYFKRVSPNLSKIEFTAALQNASTGKQFGTITIPFEVESES